MPSTALETWQTVRESELDEIEYAHSQVGGKRPGRRHATLQINFAYTMMLSSQFQGYCRELHTETIDQILTITSPVVVSDILRSELSQNRKLDYGNPTRGNLGADFNRFGLKFIDDVNALDKRSKNRLRYLDDINAWRNAIAHHDFSKVQRPGTILSLRLPTIQKWRSACRELCRTFDQVIFNFLTSKLGVQPW